MKCLVFSYPAYFLCIIIAFFSFVCGIVTSTAAYLHKREGESFVPGKTCHV